MCTSLKSAFYPTPSRTKLKPPRPRLALKARHAAGIGSENFGKDLQRHVALETRVAGAINLTHSARANLRDDLVNAELGSGGQHRHRSPLLDSRQYTADKPFLMVVLRKPPAPRILLNGDFRVQLYPRDSPTPAALWRQIEIALATAIDHPASGSPIRRRRSWKRGSEWRGASLGFTLRKGSAKERSW